MDATEQVSKFGEFFEILTTELLQKISKGERSIVVPFTNLSKFSVELAEDLLDDPENVLQAARHTIEQMDLGDTKGFEVRFSDLPTTSHLAIRNIRSTHLGKFLEIEGIVRQKSDVRPQVTNARFECPSCGNIIPVLQADQKFREPTMCASCGRKGQFRLIHKELVDAQKIVLEESPEAMEGGEQPKRLDVFLKKDLVSPITEKKTNPGSKIRVIGMVKEIPITLTTGGKSTRFDLMFDANYVEPIQEEFSNIVFTPEEIEQIKEKAKDPQVFEHLSRSLAPTIYGHDKIKEALLLQLFGGVQKSSTDGVSRRGDMHILLIGDPGSGKSALLQRISTVAPKARFVSGKGSSSAGLCVSPDSMLCTNPGGLQVIKHVVDDRLGNPHEYVPGVWKKDDVKDIRIQSMSSEMKIHSKHPASIWKLQAPKEMIEVTLTSGKKIELTANTKLFTIQNGMTQWKKSCDFGEGDFVGTPRRLVGGDVKECYVADLIISNPVVHGIKPFVKQVVERLSSKYGSTRLAAKTLGIRENQLYFHWVNEKARGNIKLRQLKRICEDVGVPWRDRVRMVSLYNGKIHSLPVFVSEDLLYCAGLIAGDGDMRKSTHSISTRLSNSVDVLHEAFTTVLEHEFSLNYDVQPGTKNTRPKATRTNSTLFGEILQSLGVCFSPKSAKLTLSETLLHLDNDLLRYFISGLYDSDGSVTVREKGSSTIEYYSTSEKLVRQMQLVLLRYGLHARLRKKQKKPGIIASRHSVWVLTIYGTDQQRKFAQTFPLKHPEKARKLGLLHSSKGGSSNIDGVPGVKEYIKTMHGRSIRDGFSRKGLQKLVEKKSLTDPYLQMLSSSDVFWDKVKSVRALPSRFDYVYDLTIEDSHNFVVNGVLVHNTASVVKDEFIRGWALEAGALVLAHKGIAVIDEMDKMSAEDTSAMHEALEQQCYEYDTVIMFADGSERKIGDFVEEKLQEYRDDVLEGHNCLILQGHIDEQMYTTDWKKVFPTTIVSVSKHRTPKKMVKISFTNGRSIVVTPEHPVFVFEKGGIATIRADAVSKDVWVPTPRNVPIAGVEQNFLVVPEEIYNPRASQHIAVPVHNDVALYRLVGHLLAEGSRELNRGKPIGVNFTNKDQILLNDFEDCMFSVFGLRPYKQEKKDDHEPRMMFRYISTELNSFFGKILPEVLLPSDQKEIPAALLKGRKEDLAHLLQTMFEGDGHVAEKARTIRIGYGTNSRRMAEQIQDILLRFGIRSSVTEHKRTYKVNITGYEHIEAFAEHIGFMNEIRKEKVRSYLCSKQTNQRTFKEVVPEIGTLLIDLLTKYGVQTVGKNKRSSMRHDYLVKKKSIARFHLKKAVCELRDRNPSVEDLKIIDYLETFVNGDVRFERVSSVETVNSKHPWTYDVRVEPHHTFISQGAVLHNTVSISKANIQATLRCQTTVLAAANPKFGRFDPYELIAKQIEMPSTLINRFDLIFPVKDLPDAVKDDKMASFILNLHRGSKMDKDTTLLETDFVRKYIAYAKQNIFPELTDAALEEIKHYYVQMRNQGQSENTISAIPISARQLEGLIRLSEASARSRLSTKVTKKDSQKAIELVHYCLSQIGVDPETGKIDIDRLTTGITAAQRSHISIIKEVITGLEKAIGKMIPVDDVVREAELKGVSSEKTTEVIDKLKRSGDLFSPKNGFVSKI